MGLYHSSLGCQRMLASYSTHVQDFTLVKTLDGHKEPLNTITVIPIELPINIEEIPVKPNADELKPASSKCMSFCVVYSYPMRHLF